MIVQKLKLLVQAMLLNFLGFSYSMHTVAQNVDVAQVFVGKFEWKTFPRKLRWIRDRLTEISKHKSKFRKKFRRW